MYNFHPKQKYMQYKHENMLKTCTPAGRDELTGQRHVVCLLKADHVMTSLPVLTPLILLVLNDQLTGKC